MARTFWGALLVAWLALPAAAERKVGADVPVLLRLPVGKLMVLVLPERLSSLTSPLPKERLQIGEDGPYVTFIATDATIEPNAIAAVGESGKLYLVRFEVVPSRGDDVVYVTQSAPVKRTPWTVASFLRALRTGKDIPTAQPSPSILPTMPDTRLILRDPQTVLVAGKHGLRVLVENTQDVPLTLDIRVGASLAAPADPQTVVLGQWVWPPRQTIRALAVEQEVLAAHGTTQLYVIFEER
jgi:hypothetical protein